MIKVTAIIIAFILIYYSIIYFALIKETSGEEFPQLRARFGTIVYHSSDKDGIYQGSFNDPEAVEHTYCYAPKAETQYEKKGGEYMLKRVDSFWECHQNWYGSFTAVEAPWASEREKIWWDREQYLSEI